MKANAKEWWLILLGLLATLVLGLVYPSFAVFFGEIFKVFARPADEILDGLHLWAGLFIVLGVVNGVAVFLRVSFFKGVFLLLPLHYSLCVLVLLVRVSLPV